MAAATTDYKREYRELYSPSLEPALVEVPEMAFLMADGHGDPNTSTEFAAAVEGLYAVAYTTKFAVKHAGGEDFRVMPLEGLWWTPEGADIRTVPPSEWNWTLMIMQPSAVSAQVVADATATVAEKKGADVTGRVRWERFAEGRCAQVMHVGPYAAEGPTIERLHAFIAEHGCAPRGHHHEIYLGDPRRTAPERLRTIIRHPVA